MPPLMLRSPIRRPEADVCGRARSEDRSAGIRYALAAVKGVGGQAMAELVAERTARGRFKDLDRSLAPSRRKELQPPSIREPRHGRRVRQPEPEPGQTFAATAPDEPRALPSLRRVIVREAGGRGRVTVVLDLPSREVEIAIPGSFKVDPKTRAAVGSLPGIVDVDDI
jgi:DNA polymerase-3 subunit alpha